jgi:Ulp1 family protease
LFPTPATRRGPRWSPFSRTLLNNKKAQIDLTDWIEIDFKSGTPRQTNDSDCGVFMFKNADYLSVDAINDFTQQEDLIGMQKAGATGDLGTEWLRVILKCTGAAPARGHPSVSSEL